MKSAALPSFWEAYRDLDMTVKSRAKKAYRLWIENPFHPSLHFKCIIQKKMFGQSGLRSTIGPWAY